MTDLRVANTLSSYSTIGAREDITDVIWRLSVTKTPFINSIRKGSASAMLHEWQLISLNSASATTQLQDGQDISFDAASEPTRRGNRVELRARSSIVSDLTNKINKAGRKSETMYQMAMRGEELKRDLEKTVLNPQAKQTAASGTPPKMAGFPSWIISNYSKDAGGTLPTGDGSDTYVNSSTLGSFTEAKLKTVLQSAFNNSGDAPDMVIMNGTYKGVMSTFTGNANRQIDAKGKQLVAAIDVYVGDFGELKCVPDVFAPANMVLVVNTDHWAVCWLQPIMTEVLAKTGLAEKRVVSLAATLEASNEAGSGAIFDLA